jgi:hypothetical protein
MALRSPSMSETPAIGTIRSIIFFFWGGGARHRRTDNTHRPVMGINHLSFSKDMYQLFRLFSASYEWTIVWMWRESEDRREYQPQIPCTMHSRARILIETCSCNARSLKYTRQYFSGICIKSDKLISIFQSLLYFRFMQNSNQKLVWDETLINDLFYGTHVLPSCCAI